MSLELTRFDILTVKKLSDLNIENVFAVSQNGVKPK